jgi:hypothetical protein
MQQITHDNHFVPQLYLKQWSDDGVHIWAYRILVSHDNVPEWDYRPIRGVAYQRDLYTSFVNGKEVDDFEKWLEEEFEKPAQESIRKILRDNHLSSLDWERLASFLGAQDVRTPLSYIESTERWEKTLPNLLRTTLEKSVRKLEQNKNLDTENSSYEDVLGLFDGILEIETVSSSESETGQGYIRAEITTGRKLWLQSQELVLTKTITVLKNHKWCIVHPARGYQWFTSDHPVVKLNYYGKGNYDLKGGWGRKGGNIFMPISPRHLLFTQIGEDLPDRLIFTSDQTKQFQSLIAERAQRWIFAQKRLNFISTFRPRHVDAEAFKQEVEQWRMWHEQQSQAEKINPPNHKMKPDDGDSVG